jgi:hypothetical protein
VPTIDYLNKNNDKCQDSVLVAIDDGKIYSGDLYNATYDEIYLTYTTQNGASSQETFGGVGRWYSFIGNGLDVSVQHLMWDLTPLVLTGSCVGGSIDPNDMAVANNAPGSILSLSIYNGFPTNINVQYWLLVYTREWQSEGEWIFFDPWAYTDAPLQNFSIPYEFSVVSQAYCEGASQLSATQDVSKLLLHGVVAEGLPSCGSASSPVSKGVWFYIQGDEDKSYRVSTKGSLGLDTQLSVFEGPCDDLLCIAGNDNAPYEYDGHSLVHFAGYAGIQYSILVHGADETATGSFLLHVEEFPINDVPGGAIPINLTSLSAQNPVVMEGSTINATADGFQNQCIYDTGSPAVWYSIGGIDQNVSPLVLDTKWHALYTLINKLLCSDIVSDYNFCGLCEHAILSGCIHN